MRLEEKIAKNLITSKRTLAVAESCSGGLLCHALTNIPGSSAFFILGIIAYDNAAKSKLLKVPARIIQTHGAVSAQVVGLMAQGVRSIHNTDFGIAITGIAGPTGGNKHKPVGLIYIAVCSKKNTIVQQFHFNGSRLQNKTLAKNAALRILWGMLA